MLVDQRIAGALFDFVGYLTSHEHTGPEGQVPGCLVVGPTAAAPPALEALKGWAATRKLNLDEALVQSWQEPVNVEAQEETVAALWEFAASIGAPVAAEGGPVDRERLDAVGVAMERIVKAFGCEVVSIQ